MTFFFSRRAVCREQELFDLCGLPHWGSNPKVDSGPRLLESDPRLSQSQGGCPRCASLGVALEKIQRDTVSCIQGSEHAHQPCHILRHVPGLPFMVPDFRQARFPL